MFTREYRAGLYGLPAYFISRNVVELPFRLLLPVLSACIIYWMVYQYHDVTYNDSLTRMRVCMCNRLDMTTHQRSLVISLPPLL